MRLIDADTLIPDVGDASIDYGIKLVHYSQESIQAAPTIDAAPVVRCKDCRQFIEYSKQRKKTAEDADGDCKIRMFNSNYEAFIGVKYNDFCSYGEKRENNARYTFPV